MNTSSELNEIAFALAKAQAAFPKIEKAKTAKVKGRSASGKEYEYAYQYADIADVLAAVLPVLSEHDLALIQPTAVENNTIVVRSRLLHKSGQWIEGAYPVCTLNPDHQKMGAAMTYARRYAACALLGIAADEDVDGQGAAAPTPQNRPPRPPQANGNGNGNGRHATPPVPPSPRPNPQQDFEAFGTWVKGKFSAAKDINELADAWVQHVEDAFTELLPPDQDRLSALYTRYQERLS